MKEIKLSDADVAALNRVANALHTTVGIWFETGHPIDRVVAGGLADSLEESIEHVIDSYPELSEKYQRSPDHFIFLDRDHPVCEPLDYWISQLALTRAATTAPLDNKPDMSIFDRIYTQAKENPDVIKYDELREFGYSAILTGQFDKFKEVYDILLSRT
jgi:hypothetical protein